MDSSITIKIPLSKLSALATAATLEGYSLSEWIVNKSLDFFSRPDNAAREEEYYTANTSVNNCIPGEEVVADGRLILEKMENLDAVIARQKEEEPTISDFFADII